MSELPQFIGLLGQREIVLIQKILHENDATEEEMKKLFEEERMRKRLTAGLQEVRAEILVQRREVTGRRVREGIGTVTVKQRLGTVRSRTRLRHANSLFAGKKTGNFEQIRRFRAIDVAKTRWVQCVTDEIP